MTHKPNQALIVIISVFSIFTISCAEKFDANEVGGSKASSSLLNEGDSSGLSTIESGDSGYNYGGGSYSQLPTGPSLPPATTTTNQQQQNTTTPSPSQTTNSTAPTFVVGADPVETPISGPVSVVASSNTTSRTDCSRSTASFSVDINNVEKDISSCMEYVFSVPTTSPLHGKSYFCDSANKFTKMTSLSSWYYTSQQHKWYFVTNNALSFIRANVVPGQYRVVVKNTDGQIHKSGWMTFNRAGKDNCKP